MVDKANEDDMVVFSDDFLTEIFLWTQGRSLLRFKTLSKTCYSIITNPNFIRLRNANVDPPCGFFLRRPEVPGQYHFVSLDVENPINTPPFTTLDFGPGAASGPSEILQFCNNGLLTLNLGRRTRAVSDPVEILQSCNGLLLCGTKSDRFYVYNPTINLFTTLPSPLGDDGDKNHLRTAVYGMTVAFDPSKSPHYKVICVKTARHPADVSHKEDPVQILVYSSETRNWRVSGKTFGTDGLTYFNQGVCCNDAIHWPTMQRGVAYFKFEEGSIRYMDFETPAITNGDYHYDFLAESHNGRLLCGIFYPLIIQFDVLEMKRDYSGWSFKYHVDLHELFTAFPGMGSPNKYHFRILCLVGGKSEEDLFFIFEIPRKLVRYNIVPKNFQKLHDFVAGSRKIDYFPGCGCFPFIPSLSGV